MSKRIFTKSFQGAVTVTGSVEEPQNALAIWLLQEDIEIIGAEITLGSLMPSENDGFALCELELSQTGVWAEDGNILKAHAGEGWNTTPAGIDQANANVVITFPQGLAIPVKEEGHLYINASGRNKTAGASVFKYEVIVYYTKRGG